MSEVTRTTSDIAAPATGGVGEVQVKTKTVTKSNEWNSKKLAVTLINMAICGIAVHEGALKDMWFAVCLATPTCIFLGGQSLIDAVERFASEKYGTKP
jgi:hypothetical protein